MALKLSDYPLKAPEAIPSPALLYFRRHIEENIDKMLQIAGGPDAAPRRLRPHIKTFKTMGVVDLLRSRGVSMFKCATIAEAEMLAAGGVTDILLAYPIVGPNTTRVAALVTKYPEVSLKVLGDDVEALASLSRALAGAQAGGRGTPEHTVEVLIDLDPGLHRTGVAFDEAPAIVRFVAEAVGISFGGLHYYDGQNHQSDFDERMAAAKVGYDTVSALVSELEDQGYAVPRMVMGGTPTFPCYARFPDAELSPGTSTIHDWGYQKAMPDLPFVPAGLVLGRVVSRPSSTRFTIDVGTKAIATDPKGQRGIILGYEEAIPVLQNEEHWVWEVPSGPGGGKQAGAGNGPGGKASGAPAIGTEVLVAPAHICPTTALYDEVVVVGPDGSIEGTWTVTARSRRLTV
jgi:D-serine deaminase-like pyridoxal phosphate-dependent protein